MVVFKLTSIGQTKIEIRLAYRPFTYSDKDGREDSSLSKIIQMLLMISTDTLILAAIVVLILSAVVVFLYAQYIKKSRAKTNTVERIMLHPGDVDSLLYQIFSTRETHTMNFSEKNPALVDLFIQELSLSRVMTVKEAVSSSSVGEGNRWQDDHGCFILEETTPNPMKIVVLLNISRLNDRDIVEDYARTYAKGDGTVDVITTFKIVFRNSDCGAECRTLLMDQARIAYTTAMVHEKVTVDGRERSHVYRVAGNSDGYFVGDFEFNVTPIAAQDLDLFYASPLVRANGVEYRPPMSLEYAQILDLVQQGKNVVISGPIRSGKTTMVQNIVAEHVKKGGYVVLLNQEVLTANQPIIQQLLSGWMAARHKEAGKPIQVLMLVDEASTVLKGDVKANVLDMMDGFSSNESNIIKSVILSLAVPAEEIPQDILGPGRCAHFVRLQYLPIEQCNRIIRRLSTKGLLINEHARTEALKVTAYSPKDHMVIGEVFNCVGPLAVDPLAAYAVNGPQEMA